MGAAASIVFEDLEARTYSALAQTSRARLALRRAKLHLTGLPLVLFLKFGLNRLRKDFTPQTLERLSPEQAAKMVALVEELYSGLNTMLKISDQKGLSGWVIYRSLLVDIRQYTECLGDILESYHLSHSSDFRKLVDNAIKELKITPHPADWRSSLAAMQDRH